MVRIKYIILVILLLGCLSVGKGNELVDAAAAYEKGDYAKAIELYQTAEKRDGTSAELLFNMGQAYTRANNLGQAMLCYQRALKLDPSMSEAKSNIRYVESKVQDANRAELKNKKYSVQAEEPTFFRSVRDYITKRHLSNTWAVWGAVCFVLLIGCIGLYVFSSMVLLRKIGFFGGGAMLLLSATFIVFAFMAASASSRIDRGVITDYKIELKADSSASAKSVAAPLTQGTLMSIIEVLKAGDGTPEWYKVRLNSDYVGWVSAENFEAI